MANPMPNEKELFDRIQNEHITVAPGIWDMLYNKIGDDVSAINLLCQFYLTNKQEIPPADAGKILTYTMDVKRIISDITTVSKDNFPFPEFKEDTPLHPIVRDIFTHYVNNDLYIINLSVYDCSDSQGQQPLTERHIQKILTRTRCIRDFLEKLREATLK